MKKSGFTLIEILVSTALLVVVLGTASTVMYTVLRSARKSAAVALAKTEGAYALRSMEQMIRYASEITNCAGNSLTIKRLNEDVIIYTVGGFGIASNGAVLTSNNVSVTACGGGSFICELNPESRVVKICFEINRANGVDVTDNVGATSADGIVFQTQIFIRNWGN